MSEFFGKVIGPTDPRLNAPEAHVLVFVVDGYDLMRSGREHFLATFHHVGTRLWEEKGGYVHRAVFSSDGLLDHGMHFPYQPVEEKLLNPHAGFQASHRVVLLGCEALRFVTELHVDNLKKGIAPLTPVIVLAAGDRTKYTDTEIPVFKKKWPRGGFWSSSKAWRVVGINLATDSAAKKDVDVLFRKKLALDAVADSTMSFDFIMGRPYQKA